MVDMSITDEAIDFKGHAGADWLRRALRDEGRTLGPFGERVADLLGWVFDGIYHIDDAVLSKKSIWDHDVYVQIALGWKCLSTYDSSYLTRLVVACHDSAIRMEVNPCNFHYLELLFHPRSRKRGNMFEYHPTIEDQIKRMRAEGRRS